eukprot:scaffold71582_cov60-Phaeocystis_antarctica.AAC.1
MVYGDGSPPQGAPRGAPRGASLTWVDARSAPHAGRGRGAAQPAETWGAVLPWRRVGTSAGCVHLVGVGVRVRIGVGVRVRLRVKVKGRVRAEFGLGLGSGCWGCAPAPAPAG